MKATAVAPSNIAFIKYWGKKDESLRLPENGSISMNLNNLLTTTTVEFSRVLKSDEISINGRRESGIGYERVINQLNRIRTRANIREKAKVVSVNNFPRSTGLSSSASGFAALTMAAASATNLTLTKKQLSILARQGSGSACRSIPDGFVEWVNGNTSKTSYSLSIFPPDHWSIIDIVLILTTKKKDMPTTQGQTRAHTSPFFTTRMRAIKKKIKLIKHYIAERDFTHFGELTEAEALELHAIMMTSQPSLIYWLPDTVRIMKWVQKIRSNGLLVYFTVNTGQNIHLIVQARNQKILLNKLKTLDGITQVIVNHPAQGARITNNHLF